MLKKLLTLSFILLVSSCGFHFQQQGFTNGQLSSINLESNDPYDNLSRAVRNQLKLNGIQISENESAVDTLRLQRVENKQDVVSVFKYGREAEKILTLTVTANLNIVGKGNYPIKAQIARTFFDNPRAALAKNAEKEMILQQMYDQVARQILVKVAALKQQVQ